MNTKFIRRISAILLSCTFIISTINVDAIEAESNSSEKKGIKVERNRNIATRSELELIPNETVREIVKTKLAIEGEITESDLSELTDLDLSGSDFSDGSNAENILKGLEYAINLTSINLSNCSIADISILTPLNISGSKVKNINLSHNNISDLSKLTLDGKKYEFDFSYNKINKINSTTFDPKFYDSNLNLSYNAMTEFKLPNLTVDQETEVDKIVGGSRAPKGKLLIEWDLSNNNLKSDGVDAIEYPQKIALAKVNLSHNELVSLNFYHESGYYVNELDLSYNKIGSDPNIKVIEGDKSLDMDMFTLNLDYNSVRTIDWLSKVNEIDEIDLRNNEIEDISFLKDLKNLNTSNSSEYGGAHVLTVELDNNHVRDFSPLAAIIYPRDEEDIDRKKSGFSIKAEKQIINLDKIKNTGNIELINPIIGLDGKPITEGYSDENDLNSGNEDIRYDWRSELSDWVFDEEFENDAEFENDTFKWTDVAEAEESLKVGLDIGMNASNDWNASINLYVNFTGMIVQPLGDTSGGSGNSSGSGGSGGGSTVDPLPPAPSNSKSVILASGEKYTDVLTATVLGNEKDAPILLATKDTLDNNTIEEIKRLDPSEIIVSGGPESVSDKALDQLSEYNVTRISGKDRYETAIKIGDEVRALTGNKTGSMLVDGTNFPDVITMSTLASQNRVPILLTEPSKLNNKTKDTISTWGVNDITIGGSYNSVSKEVENDLDVTKVNRLGGADRYATAELIATEVRKYGSKDNMILVDGTNFPDGITINSLASNFNAPIMLTTPATLSKVTVDKVSEWSIKNVLIGGGYNSVSKSVEDSLDVIKKERVAGEDRYETAVKISQRLSDGNTGIGDK